MAVIDWHALLANLAIVALVMLLWTQGQDHLPARWARFRPSLFGATMALGSFLAMFGSAQLAPGVFVDLKTSFIAVAGFFGGPVGGLIAIIASVIGRLAIGGGGIVAGTIGMMTAGLVGITGHAYLAGREPARHHVLMLAAVVTLIGCGATFLLPAHVLDEAIRWLGPISLSKFVGTSLAGIVVLEDSRRRRAEAQSKLYFAVIQALPDCLNVKDLQGAFLAANPATARLMRASSAMAMIGKTDFDFYPEDVARRFQEEERQTIATNVAGVIEQMVAFDDGSIAWLSTLKAPLVGPSGDVIGLITHNRDITERKRLRDELSLAQRRLYDAMAHMADGLAMFDAAGTLLLCNSRYRELFPLTADLRVPGVTFATLMRAAINRGEETIPSAEVERWIGQSCANLRSAGERIFNLADGRWLEAKTRLTSDDGSLVVVADITKRKKIERKLARAVRQLEGLASTDGLTGLATRRTFDQTLDREIARNQREGLPLSLLLIDVDRFKAYNDAYGHPAGDDCLQFLSHALGTVLRRPGDMGARYGGEEFAAILPNTDAKGAATLAETYRSTIRGLRLAHSGSEYGMVTVSIGVATMDASGGNARDLVQRADAALYAAKGGGRNQVTQAKAA